MGLMSKLHCIYIFIHILFQQTRVNIKLSTFKNNKKNSGAVAKRRAAPRTRSHVLKLLNRNMQAVM